MTPNSNLVNWQVIEIWDTEVPDEILAAIKKDQKNADVGYVYTLMWKDAFFYHGEESWCISDELIAVAEAWFEEHRKFHGLADNSCFWFRIKAS